jgi:hypothetical protein
MIYGKASLHDHYCSSCGDLLKRCKADPDCQASNNNDWETCADCMYAEYQWSIRSSTSWIALSAEDRRTIKSIVKEHVGPADHPRE